MTQPQEPQFYLPTAPVAAPGEKRPLGGAVATIAVALAIALPLMAFFVWFFIVFLGALAIGFAGIVGVDLTDVVKQAGSGAVRIAWIVAAS